MQVEAPVGFITPTFTSCKQQKDRDRNDSSRDQGEGMSSSGSCQTHARPPTTPDEVDEQLDLILHALGQLQLLRQNGHCITEREVLQLRKAFLFSVREEMKQTAPPGAHTSTSSSPLIRASDYHYSPKAAAADRILVSLEEHVKSVSVSNTFGSSSCHFSWQSIWHTPIERRIQTIAVSLFTFFTGVPLCILVAVLCLYFKYTAPLMIAYLIYIFTIGQPKHPLKKNMPFCRLHIWNYYRDYFPVRLVIPKYVRRQFDPTKNYIFICHPHGVHSFGAITNFGLDSNGTSRLLPGITTHSQTLSVNFYIPFWRELMFLLGAGDASAQCIRKTLRSGEGQSVMLAVGGAEESLLAKPYTNDLLLYKRKGFVKIALCEGSPLVPVYAFGENNVYELLPFANEAWAQRITMFVKKRTGFTVPLVTGRGYFNFKWGPIPHRRPIVVVVGEPLVVPKITNPTSADLDKWHARYIEALTALYEENRGVYDLESTGLQIIR